MRNSIQKVDFTLADAPRIFLTLADAPRIFFDFFFYQTACGYQMLGRIQIKVSDR